MRRTWKSIPLVCAVLLCVQVSAELPLARLTSVYPPGGQAGSTVQVTLTGADLEGVTQLHFARAGLAGRWVKPPTTAPSQPLKFDVSISAAVPPGIYDLRAVGRFGVTNPRAFEVTARPATTAPADNVTAEKAAAIPFDSAVFATAQPNARQFFRVALQKGQRACVDVATTSLDSLLDAQVVLSDPTGHELARSRNGTPIAITAATAGPYTIAIHDVLYRGGADYFYRLAVGPSPLSPGIIHRPLPAAAAFLDDPVLSLARLVPPDPAAHDSSSQARKIEPPCVVQGEFRAPRYRDGYGFDAPTATAYVVEVISQRLGQPAAPTVLAQRMTDKGPGDVAELTPLPASPGASEFSAATRDPAYRLEIKQPGSYRLLVRDLFGEASNDGRPVRYTLIVRRPSPDFALVVVPASPLPEPKDSRDVPVWSTFIRRGGVTPIRVVADRRDGFSGEIHLGAEHLPAGLTASEATIAAGASSAEILLSAAEDAPGSVAAIDVLGSATIDGREVRHLARPGVVADRTYDAQTKEVVVHSRRSDEFVVAVSGSETSPISLAPPATQPSFTATTGGKASILLEVKRRAEFTSPLTMRIVGHPPLAASPEQAVDAKAKSATFLLDLAKLKLPAGRYVLHAEGEAKLKYAGKDVTASIYSAPFVLSVKPPPTTQPTTRPASK
jgi:hypothetical protein